MKRNIAIIFAVLISLSMIGCSQSTSSEEESSIKSVTQYGITAVVAEVLEDGQYKVEVTGGDDNFVIGDIVIINNDNTVGRAEKETLKIGDTIAITYSIFAKSDTGDEITPGQIEVITR